jgi:hypothetical protein
MHGNGNGQGYEEDRGEGSKRNPLLDLMDSERIYVEQLALVIRVSQMIQLKRTVLTRIAGCCGLVEKRLSTPETGRNVSLRRSSLQSKQGFWHCKSVCFSVEHS